MFLDNSDVLKCFSKHFASPLFLMKVKKGKKWSGLKDINAK